MGIPLERGAKITPPVLLKHNTLAKAVNITTHHSQLSTHPLDPFKFHRISFIGVPLTYVDILVSVHTYVMAMLKDRFFLHHHLQFAFFILRFRSAGIRDHLIISIKDCYKA